MSDKCSGVKGYEFPSEMYTVQRKMEVLKKSTSISKLYFRATRLETRVACLALPRSVCLLVLLVPGLLKHQSHTVTQTN